MLVDKDEISKQQYDQAVAAAEAAQATLDAQKALVNEAQQNISAAEESVEQARARVEQADAHGAIGAMTGPQQVKVTEAQALNRRQAKVEQQQAAARAGRAESAIHHHRRAGQRHHRQEECRGGQQCFAGTAVDGDRAAGRHLGHGEFQGDAARKMRVGQPVKIKVDAYDREYTGTVQRIAGASGAKFSLLPPENATGNYVKVVQRIPVRIALDPGQNQDHLLRPGMSVVPSVRVQ